MRKEEAIFVFGRDAVTGVLHADFYGLGVAVRACRNHDFAKRRGFERFGGIVDEIDDHATEQAAVCADRRKIVSERSFEGDAVEAAGEDLDGFLDDGVGAGRREFGGGEADELRELIDELRESGDFALDQARAFLGQTRQFGIEWVGDFGGSAAIEKARQPLRRELNRRERILDFVRDAASDLLPRGGFLSAQHFGQIVEHEDEAGVGAARAERADGDGKVKDAAGDDRFDFTRDDAHAEAAAHEELNGAGGFGAEEIFEGFDVACAAAKHARDGRVFAEDVAFGIERNNAGRDVFENGFHQLAAALEFLHSLLKVAGELVDLSARVAELRGHRVERADENAEFVLRLLGNLIVEIT
jgi:hypothetical protein